MPELSQGAAGQEYRLTEILRSGMSIAGADDCDEEHAIVLVIQDSELCLWNVTR